MHRVMTNPSVPLDQPHHPTTAADAVNLPPLVVRRRGVRPHVLVDVWREAVTAFGTHAGPVLVITVVGFASVSAATQLVGLLARQPLGIHMWPWSSPWLSLPLAVLSLLLQTLGQGALTWIGLRGTRAGAPVRAGLTARRAAHTAWRHLSALLPAALLHAVLTFVCALGLLSTAPAYLGPDSDGLPRLIVTRGRDALLTGPLHPLADHVLPARHAMRALYFKLQQRDESPSGAVTRNQIIGAYLPSNQSADPLADPWHEGLTALFSVALLVITETLLRFRVAAAMQRDQSPALGCAKGDLSLWAPLRASACLSGRHIWAVLASTWVLRLGVSAIQITCILLPGAIADNVILPQLVWASAVPWGGLVCRGLSQVSGVLVSALLAAFCVIYDARLFVALQQAERDK
jgi:hypothetical protein